MVSSSEPVWEPAQRRLPRPALWLALATCGGLAVGLPAGAGLTALWPAVGLGSALLLVTLGRGRVALAGGLLLACAAGIWRAEGERHQFAAQPVVAWCGQTLTLELRAAEPPSERPTGWVFAAKVTRVMTASGRWAPVDGRVRVRWNALEASEVLAGARITARGSLERPRTAGNPGQFDHRRYLRSAGLAAVFDIEVGGVLDHRPTWWQDASRRLRRQAVGRLEAAMLAGPGGESVDLLAGLVYGRYAAPQPGEIEELYRRTGVVHVLVASGTQVSLLLGLVWWLVSLSPLPRWSAFFLGLGVMLPYIMITGLEPSILRATVMGGVILVAFSFGEDPDLATTLAVAAAALLWVAPSQRFDVGFQLSFAACVGLAAVGRPLAVLGQQRWPGPVGRFVVGTLVYSFAAQLFVSPVLLWQFQELSMIGLLANLVMVPLAGLLVACGLLLSLLGTSLGAVGPLLGRGCHGLMSLGSTWVGWMDQVPGAWRDPLAITPTGLGLILAGLAILALSLHGTCLRAVRREAVVVALAALLAAWSVWGAWRLTQAELVVRVFDVGTGDSILLVSPTGRTVLIDGGPYRLLDSGKPADTGREVLIPALSRLGVTRLDLVVATHPDSDHIGGLATVVRNLPVGRLLVNALPEGQALPQALRQAAAQRGVPLEPLTRGARINLGGGARLFCLWPPATPIDGTDSDRNNNSVVLKLVHGECAFLFPADLENRGAELLLRHAGDLSAHVLKVPHQGASDANDAAFLDAVAPQYAVISVGRNQYGHPAPATLDRLAQRKVVVHRTDRDGMVTYRSDGSTILVTTYR